MEEAILEDDLIDCWILFVETYKEHVVFTVETYLNGKLFLLDVDLEEFKIVITLQAKQVGLL